MMRTKIYTSWDELPIMMDLPMVAIITGMSHEYIRQLAKKGEFPAFKITPQQWRVNKSDLQKWIEERKNQ